MQSRFLHDFVTIRKFGDRYKLTYFKTPVRGEGEARPDGRRIRREDEDQPEKMDNSLSRTKAAVYELAACNPWEHFVTLTLSPEKYDRYNLSKFRADLAQFLRNYNRIHGCGIKYLLIPEQHQDGAWHMHGLVMGIPNNALSVNKNGYRDFPAYASRFGFCSIDDIRDKDKVSSYITKYISKDLSDRREELHAHLYYASKGLNRSEKIYVGSMKNADKVVWDFENEYVKVKWGLPGDFGGVEFLD